MKTVTDDPIVWQTSHVTGRTRPDLGSAEHSVRRAKPGFLSELAGTSADDGQSGGFWLSAAPAWSLDNTTWRAPSSTAQAMASASRILRRSPHRRHGARPRPPCQPTIDGAVWDEGNALEVIIQTPGLAFESRSDLEVLDGTNLLLVGQEIIQFATAVQIGSLTWRLSKLLRGRYGTEWAMATHEPGEAVLLLDPATLTRVSSLDEVGIERLYRTVSIGSDPSLPDAIGFTNEATSLKPHAPVHIQGSRNGAGDLTITWVRRTRHGGAWRDLVDVPLNETSESYEIDVLDQDDTVLRTLISSSATVAYTAADQTSDFGAPQSSITVAIHQLSAAVGRGIAGRASL